MAGVETARPVPCLWMDWSSSLAGYLVLVDGDRCSACMCWLAGLALLAFAAVFAELWSDGRRAWGRSVAAAFAALFLLRSRCALSSTCSSCVEIDARKSRIELQAAEDDPIGC